MWLDDGKPVTESYEAISISKLRKTDMFRNRGIVQRSFQIADVEMVLVKDPQHGDWYLKMTKYGPKNQCNAITLVRTKCNYGGYREWLECPRCKKRAGVLYLHEDDFACRKCLDLRYWSQKMNYRTLMPTVRNMVRLNEMSLKDKINYQHYKNKQTRRSKRYEKLRESVSFGTSYRVPAYLRGEMDSGPVE